MALIQLAAAALAASVLAVPTQSISDDRSALAAAMSRDLGITVSQAHLRLAQQENAHRAADRVAAVATAGMWFDPDTGKLHVAVTDPGAAAAVRSTGAEPKLVKRGKVELDQLAALVRAEAGAGVAGLNSFGIDPVHNDVTVTINPARADAGTARFLAAVRKPGVRVVEAQAGFVQQAGEVNPGDPWWPGSESNCSIGFAATDSGGGKHFVTAGHCTNDANQAAYGESGQRNRIGTSNVGGSRSVNAREGDMGVVAVTEAGWTLSANVNTWGQPAIAVTGSRDALVGEAVCHSGNTAPNFECGRVNAVNQTVNYGSVVIDGLTLTTACSQGGDSGGAWLSGDKAVGLHSGGVSSCSAGQSGDNSIFQPVNEALTRWGLTLVTGGGNPGDTQPPTAPGNPRATGTTASAVSLAWDASTDNVGVTGYDVYNGSTLVASVASTSATVSGLASDTSYTFTVRARDGAGNVSPASAAVTARTQPGGGGGRTFSNGTDHPIRDYQVTVSRIQSTATGTAARPLTVKVTASHTCTQDLNITLVSPTGWWYYLQTYGGYPCTAFPGTKTFQVQTLSGEPASGTWTLRIGDNGPGDAGVLDSWTITL